MYAYFKESILINKTNNSEVIKYNAVINIIRSHVNQALRMKRSLETIRLKYLLITCRIFMLDSKVVNEVRF